MIISPSIISADFTKLKSEIEETEKAGADWLHIDVMDGRFVPNLTVGPMIVSTCKKASSLPLDVHLMIVEPENHIKAFIDAGASRLGIHVENNPNVLRTLQSIRELGAKPTIVLNPGTSIDQIEYLLPFVNMVLVMTVNPGFSGQKFIPEMLPKIKKLRNMIDQSGDEILIQADGGINEDTVRYVLEAGADVIVAATAVYKHPQGIMAGIHALRK